MKPTNAVFVLVVVLTMAALQPGRMEQVFVSEYEETANDTAWSVKFQLSTALPDSSRCFKTNEEVYKSGCGGLALDILRAANPHRAIQGKDALIESVEVHPLEIQTLVYVRTRHIEELEAARPLIFATFARATGKLVQVIP